MSNPNTKIYLASQALQTETNNKIDTLDETVHTDIGAVQTAVENAIGDVEDTVHADITAVSQDINTNFVKPDLTMVHHYILDYAHDPVVTITGFINAIDRKFYAV